MYVSKLFLVMYVISDVMIEMYGKYSVTSPLGHLHLWDTKFGPGKSLYPLPLLKGHLYSGKGTLSLGPEAQF